MVLCKLPMPGRPTLVVLQWLEHLWNHGNKFETGVVRANECKYSTRSEGIIAICFRLYLT